MGFDYGFTHNTVFVLLAKDEDGNVYVVDSYGKQKTLPEIHYANVTGMLSRHNLRWHGIRNIAAGQDVFSKDHRGKTIAKDYQDLNVRLTNANMDRINGAAEILTRLGDPENGLHPRLFIHPSNVKLIDQIVDLEHDPHRPEDVLKTDVDEDGNGGDDFYDAFRYGIMEDREALSSTVMLF